jgi:hypothetical protein
VPIYGRGLDGSDTQINEVRGFTLALNQTRDYVWATFGRSYATNSDPRDTYIQGGIKKEEWNHIYFANEGDGIYCLYVNGLRTGILNQNSAGMALGGLCFGGRESDREDEAGYLTGYIDDIRMVEGWLPYEPGNETIPVPVEPLDTSQGKYKFGTLDQLTDVRNTGPETAINGQALIYNGIDDVWEPGDAPGYDISANSIGEFVDVNTANSVADQDDILKWNAAEGYWERSKVDGNGGVRPLNHRTPVPGAVPQAGTIYAGELFLNMADRKLWALDDAGQPFNFANGDLDEKIQEITRVVGGDF